jgi:serine phosphatase RsbU (regulator of sigma subunit)
MTPSNESPRIRALVIDDEIAEDIARVLRLEGLEVQEADGIRTGIEAIQQGLFDVAVLDMRMPNLAGELDDHAGLTVLRWAAQFRPSLPIVVLTVLPASAVTLPALELGAAGYLLKEEFPGSLKRLLEAVLAFRRDGSPIEPELVKQVERQRRYQLSAFPTPLTIGEKLSIAGSNIRKLGASGDLYDFIYLREREQIAFFIADVMGKGVDAAFVASRLSGVFRVGARRGWSLAEIDSQLHQTIRDFDLRDDELFAEGVIGLLHLKSRWLEWLQAAGRPLSVRERVRCSFLGDLQLTGQAWGMDLPGRALPATECAPFHPGHSLVLCTDGILDQPDAGGVPFGPKCLQEQHLLFDGADARGLCERLLHQAIMFRGTDPDLPPTGLVLALHDDLTVMAIHWRI